MDNRERIAGLAEVEARWARYREEHRLHHERMRAFVDAHLEDAAEADALVERTDELRVEREEILRELERVDPAFSAAMN